MDEGTSSLDVLAWRERDRFFAVENQADRMTGNYPAPGWEMLGEVKGNE